MKTKRNPVLENLEYALFMTVSFIARIIPLKLAYALSVIAARIVYIFDRKHRTRVLQHLMHAGVAKDEDEARRIARRNFAHFAKFAVEFCKTRQFINPDSIGKVITFEGSEKSKKLFFNPGKSSQAIIVTAHIGNWELAGFAYTLLSGMPLLTVMRPFDNRKIGEVINRRRIGYNHTICPKNGALKSLLTGLKHGSSVCFVADQHAGSFEGVETSFFGHPARAHLSPAILHLRTGVPIMPAFLVRNGENYKLVLSEPIIYPPTDDKDADLKAIAQLYTTEIEKIVAKYPDQWLWAHRRWLDINRERRK